MSDVTSANNSHRRNDRGFRCSYRALLRACGKRELLAVMKAAKVGGSTEGSRKTYRSKLRRGVPLDKKVFDKLARELHCEPTNLYFIPEQFLPHFDSPAYSFAVRVAVLLEDEIIPQIDPDTNAPPNVVQYALEMADPILDSYQLTLKELRQAFIILRDYLMLVVEQPIETKRKHPLPIGVMTRGATSKDDLVADVRARKAASIAAFEQLRGDFQDDNPFHINRIRSLVEHRFDLYLNASSRDQTQWVLTTPSVEQLDKQKWKKLSRHTAMELVRNVIDADFHLRKVIFPTYQQDEAFSAYYSRSRQLIEWIHLHSPRKFPTWWNRFREHNTQELREFVNAWHPRDFGAEPNWDLMEELLEKNLYRTEQEIWLHYPDSLLPKSLRKSIARSSSKGRRSK